MKELENKLNQIIERFFDNISQISLHQGGKKVLKKCGYDYFVFTDEPYPNVDEDEQRQEVSKILFQLENIQILYIRINENCFQLKSTFSNNKEIINTAFFKMCWDKWLQYVENSILSDILDLDMCSYNNNFRYFWFFFRNFQVNGLEIKIENFSNGICFDSVRNQTKDEYLKNKIAPVRFIYEIARRTENISKIQQIFAECVDKRIPQDLFRALISLNGLSIFFQEQNMAMLLKKKIGEKLLEIFPGKKVEEIANYLCKYRYREQFTFLPLVCMCNIKSAFMINILKNVFLRCKS